MARAWGITELHPADSLHLKHVLAYYGRDWIGTWAKTEASAIALAATWQGRLSDLENQHPELANTK
jgi:hypothetical protein